MKTEGIGVRQLKANLSRYLRRVKEGETISITEHGREVGRIVPTALSLEERLQAMLQAGTLSWSGKKLKPMIPVARASGKRTVADLLIEDRRPRLS